MRLFLQVTVFVFCLYRIAQAQPALKQSQVKISDDVYYSLLTDSVYMITHYFPKWGGNSMFVLLPGNKGVLVDTPFETTGTISLLDWISKNFGKLVLTAIVTGFHQDNLGGNEVLLSNGINVYGADLTKQLIEEKGDELKQDILQSVKNDEDRRFYDSYVKLKLTPPDKTFPIKEGLKLELGNEIFEVYFPGESHTIDNTVVYLHQNKILFGGCMLKGPEYNNPGYLKYANMEEWPKSVEKVTEKFPDCKIVVPGHGSYGGMDVLYHTSKILDDWKKNQKNKID